MSEFSLDRQQNIANNIDASGKKWEVLHKRGTAMYLARPVPDRKDAVIPARFAGFWTKAQLCQDQITMYCEQSWNEADRIAAKNRRTAPPTPPHPDTPSPEEMIAEAEGLVTEEAPLVLEQAARALKDSSAVATEEGKVVTETPEEAVEAIIEEPLIVTPEDTQAAIQAQIDADNAEFEAKNAARAAEQAQDV